MLKDVNNIDFENALIKENPSWNKESVKKISKESIEKWDTRLSDIVRNYVSNGKITDFSYGEFTVLHIRGLRHNCGFLHAVSLMDEYLKDNKKGKAIILRR